MSDAAASDDSDLRNIVHAGTTFVATGFAIAERTDARGGDILTAIVLGYEAAGRLVKRLPPAFALVGFTVVSSRSLAGRSLPAGCCS